MANSMTKMEFFQQYGTIGLDLGIISPGKFAFYIRYNVYQNYILDGLSKSEAIARASDECCCDITGIYRAITFFAENRNG